MKLLRMTGCHDGVVQIMPMHVEAGDIAARVKLQGTVPLGMPLAASCLADEAEGGHPGKRSTSGDEEVTSRQFKGSFSLCSGHRRSPLLT